MPANRRPEQLEENTIRYNPTDVIRIRGAHAHNLRDIDLDLPHNRLVVITGVSGSGKSSLAFDTICREGQRRYLESFSNRARLLLGKLGQPDVDSIEHLSPAIALDQKTAGRNPRSTVGTASELFSYLRLLFARLGNAADGQTRHRSDFSFNSTGACPACQGLGVQDTIAPELLIADPDRTLREGALVITTGSGYIIYSQVTMEVLNQVCQAHGFDVDIPWRELTAEQRQVVLYGSDRLEIPFGKHTLESRLKWSGITARPRQTGKYGGIIPVMTRILKRDRNRNILRFVRTGRCDQCDGTRLNERARSVSFAGRTIAAFSAMSIAGLDEFFAGHRFPPAEADVGRAIAGEIRRRTGLLLDLGLGYLTLDRDAPSLSGGEAQRIGLAAIAGSGLRGMTYVLDEPSIGLHPHDQQRLLRVLRRLVDQGNSVLVVEHDRQTMLAADWLVDIGPGAGRNGGDVLYSGPVSGLLAVSEDPVVRSSLTRAHLRGDTVPVTPSPRRDAGCFTVHDARLHNLRGLNVEFRLAAINVVTGISGAGKSSLLSELGKTASRACAEKTTPLRKVVTIDQKPIGRTPRSNAATYTGLFDHLRTLFAAQRRARELGLGKGQFSFNNKGGRCPACEGAGVQRLGMHFLGDVEIPCPECGGRRFGDQILGVTYRGLNISDTLALPLDEAAEFFADQPRLAPYLDRLVELGLGYLSLGQPSTTLSGGEAQRVKLAAELHGARTCGTLYILDEPTTGLHAADVDVLLAALDRLVAGGGTVVVSEHSSAFIRFADRVLDLGPGSGDDGGRLVFAGPPSRLASCPESLTGRYLVSPDRTEPRPVSAPSAAGDQPVELLGVQTHNLRNIDVSIPVGRITVVTGVSGSGKSSLAIDTLFAEGRSRYAENFSTYIRQQLAGRSGASLAGSRGLMPTVAIGQSRPNVNPRSTVATGADIHPLLRLLLSRGGQGFAGNQRPRAAFFSFNQVEGACPECRGLGRITACDPDKLVTDPALSLLAGAMDGHKTGRFYGEPDGQFTATLRQVGRELGWDFSQPWQELTAEARKVAMHGAGQREFDVVWRFKRGRNQGEHEFSGQWPGFCGLVDAEYERKHADRRGQGMLAVMSESECPACDGRRLRPAVEAVTCAGLSIAAMCALNVDQAHEFFGANSHRDLAPFGQLCDELARRLGTLQQVGLGYLDLDRSTDSLATGEQRRLRLARQLGAGLRGVTYVLDEPTLGLHPRDTRRLWRVLTELRDQGNTLVLVEHDPDLILAADHVIDLGPGAGRSGGRIVAQGPPAAIVANENSVTGRCLRELADPAAAPESASAGPTSPPLLIRRARCHNLQHIDVEIPTGRLTAVVGVSGSGKTSLVFGTLAASVVAGRPVACDEIQGYEHFRQTVTIGSGLAAGPVGGTPATAAGLAVPIRALLAGTQSARQAGLTSRHFATAGRGGRCETCRGSGRTSTGLDFLPDVHTTCPDCHGQGFTRQVLGCRWRQRNIADILDLTVDEALEFFADRKKIAPRLQLLHEVGLSYLTLGQPTRTLSGGERQRLLLACRLLPGSRGPDLLLCDEPTAGLHLADVAHLIGLLRRLTAAGHTVVVTEHNRQLIAAADRVIGLGPGAGPAGGRLVAPF